MQDYKSLCAAPTNHHLGQHPDIQTDTQTDRGVNFLAIVGASWRVQSPSL